MTRKEAIAIVGEELVNKLEATNCEPTNRVGYNGACQDDELTEWRADIDVVTIDGDTAILSAYYYTSNDDDQRIADAGGDGSAIDWTVEEYEIR